MREGFIQAGASAYFDKGGELAALRDWIVDVVNNKTPAAAA